MDNRHIVVCGDDKEELITALGLFRKAVVGYNIIDNKLILYWASCSTAILFPSCISAETTGSIIWAWLMEKAKYPLEPEHDGDNSQGFKIYNEDWNMVMGIWEAFAIVEPYWAMYGK